MTLKYNGIDVSKHQGTINWDQLATDSNVDFVIIRAGYGRYYPSQIDAQFETNYQQAKEHNIPVGAYWYSYATTADEVRQEMAAFCKTIQGKSFEFPLYFDQEYEKSIVALSNETRTEIVTTALKYLEEQGYYAALYCSADWINNKLNYTSLAAYDLWIAQYASSCTSKLPYGMWQYSSKGSVKGISGNVDMDRCYKDYPTIIKEAGLNGFSKGSTTSTSTPSTPTTSVTSTDYVLDWPLKGSHIITAGWKYSSGVLHRAIDLRVDYKQPVYAAGDGTVNMAYKWNGKVTSGDTNSYGNCVKIQHTETYKGGKVETLYAHLDSFVVSKGQAVKAGQLIGYAGYTGYVVPSGINGKHLHFEVRYKSLRRNPLVWLDNDFTTANSNVFTFQSGEKSAVRGTASPTTTPTQKSITLKNGTWNVRKGAGTSYASVGQIKSPGADGKAVCIGYSAIVDGWYKTIYGYIGPAAVKEVT